MVFTRFFKWTVMGSLVGYFDGNIDDVVGINEVLRVVGNINDYIISVMNWNDCSTISFRVKM